MEKVKIIKDTPTGVDEVIRDVSPDALHACDYIERSYPETIKEFKRLQKEQYELFCKKQMDYGPSNISLV